MLSVEVLGRVAVRLDETSVAVPAGLTTELLVRLALDAGTAVRAERLLADLWPDDPQVRPNTLQAKVSQLRRALGGAAALTGGAAGYRLVVDAVDAREALRLAADGTARLAAGDPAGAAAACAAGLALFGPEILPAAGPAEWALPHRVRLEEARLQLTEDGLAARLALGAAGELVGELEALVAAHPLREGLWTLLVTALYRAGRQSDALAAHRRVTVLLAEELGVDPGPALAEVGRRVLDQDPGLAPRPRRTGNLPALGSPLIGRATERAALAADLADHRLVTLVGPAGVGKTRLAVEAAREAPVAWLVRLEGVRSADGISAALADAVPGAETADPSAALRGSEALLLVDNCEHLAEEVAELVVRVLDAAPGIRVLATSQRSLGVDGERVHTLEPLPEPDAVALFTARARPGSGDGVAELCRALDCLPLAIELAAARTRVLTVPEISARLGDRFTLLADPTSTRPRRRRTLAAALSWSYDLLFPDDQRGLWALAGFPDGAAPAGLEHVLGRLGVPTAAALDVVGRLVDRSLATAGTEPAPQGQDRTGGTRYRLLDSVRSFATDRAAEAGAAGTVADAVAGWVAELAAEVDGQVRGPGQAAAVARTAAERATIDVALAHARGPAGLRLAVGFGWAWILLDDDAAAARLRAARLAAPDAPAGLRARALLLESWLEAMSGDLGAARTAFDAVDRSDVDDAAVLARHAGFLLSQEGRFAEALAALGEPEPGGDPWEDGARVLLAVFPHLGLGDPGAARAACEEAIARIRPLGDAWGLLHAESALGRIAYAEGRFTDAARHHADAADAAGRLGFGGAATLHLVHLGRALHESGDPTAEATLRRAVQEAERAGDLRLLAEARVRLGEVLVAGGSPSSHAEAREHLRAADRWFALAGPGEGADVVAGLLAELGPTPDPSGDG